MDEFYQRVMHTDVLLCLSSLDITVPYKNIKACCPLMKAAWKAESILIHAQDIMPPQHMYWPELAIPSPQFQTWACMKFLLTYRDYVKPAHLVLSWGLCGFKTHCCSFKTHCCSVQSNVSILSYFLMAWVFCLTHQWNSAPSLTPLAPQLPLRPWTLMCARKEGALKPLLTLV